MQTLAQAGGFEINMSVIQCYSKKGNISIIDHKSDERHSFFFERWINRDTIEPRMPQCTEDFIEFNKSLYYSLLQSYRSFFNYQL